MPRNKATHKKTKLPAMKEDDRGSLITDDPRYLQPSIGPSKDNGPSSTTADGTNAEVLEPVPLASSAIRHTFRRTKQRSGKVTKNHSPSGNNGIIKEIELLAKRDRRSSKITSSSWYILSSVGSSINNEPSSTSADETNATALDPVNVASSSIRHTFRRTKLRIGEITTDSSMSGNNDTHKETKLPAMKKDYRGSIITGRPKYIQASVDASEDNGPSATSADGMNAKLREYMIPTESASRKHELAKQRRIMKESMQLKLNVDQNESMNSSKVEGEANIVNDLGNDEKDYLQCQRRNRGSRIFTGYVPRKERVSRVVNIDDAIPSTSDTDITYCPSIEEISPTPSVWGSCECLDIEDSE